MKKLLPLLAPLLLLAACGKGEAVPTPPAETPAPTALVTPAPEPEVLRWGVNYSLEDIDTQLLPTQVATSWEESSAVEQNGVPFFLLGQVPEADISLYGFWLPSESGVLVRRGETYTHFPQEFAWSGGSQIPELRWSDLDGDGAEELGVIYAGQAGSQSFVSQLHVYEWSDGWTDHPFSPEAYSTALDELLEVSATGETLTVTYGQSSVDYTNGPNDSGTPALCTDYASMVFFRFDKTGPAVIFPLHTLHTVAGLHNFASLSAEVDYDGQSFTLRNISLTSTGGV